MDDKEFTYLLEAYKAAIDYLNGYADRVSNRFNILLTLNIAAVALFGNIWLNPQTTPSKNGLFVSALGLAVSVLLYIQSAQDRYMFRQQRKRINAIRQNIEKNIGRNDIPALFAPLDEADTGKRKFIFESLTSWNSSVISLTSIPVIASILLTVFWIITLFARK
jgi:hypothetical protein